MRSCYETRSKNGSKKTGFMAAGRHTPETPMSIDIQHISKQFGNFQALSDVNLNIGSGELVALLEP